MRRSSRKARRFSYRAKSESWGAMKKPLGRLQGFSARFGDLFVLRSPRLARQLRRTSGDDSVTEKLPKKLRVDAILEVLFDVRFEPDRSLVAEVIIGRFADIPELRGFNHVRLPSADIPAQFRRADPNLKFQPSVDMTSPDGRITFRVGPYSIVFVRRGGYPGWSVLGPNSTRWLTILSARSTCSSQSIRSEIRQCVEIVRP